MLRHKSKPIQALVLFLSISQLCHLEADDEHTWQEAFQALGIAWNPDGTLNRTVRIPMVDPTPDGPTVLSKDVEISSERKAYVRLYRPANATMSKKLPLIIYFHGGDFVLFSAKTLVFHNFCNDIAAQLPAVVVSVEYRLAPEHRLPAAYDDALSALLWAADQARGLGGRDPFLDYVDFSGTFLLGSSAGANIAYHLMLRSVTVYIRPLEIRGLILNQGYFGGVNRTGSEIRLKDDPYLALYVNDVLWSLALPENLNRDHEFCNPILGGLHDLRVYRLPRVYIKGDYGDPLFDRSFNLAGFLEFHRVPVYYRFDQGGYHGVELSNTTAAQILYNDIKAFVYGFNANLNSEEHDLHSSY